MKRKKISEIVKLKLQNCNLSLQILQMQANEIIFERDKTLNEEMKILKCDPKKWEFDKNTWELFEKDIK